MLTLTSILNETKKNNWRKMAYDIQKSFNFTSRVPTKI